MPENRPFNPISEQDVQGLSGEALLELLEMMETIRAVEETVAELVATGEIRCPCHLYIGQEAVAAGACAALETEDLVFSTHRSHGHYLAKGGDMEALFAECLGLETGCSRGRGGSMHLAAPEAGLPGSSSIVAGTLPSAVGAALGYKISGQDHVAAALFGDGATCEGTFYESLNLAALKALPVVFFCENNFYSTHMPIEAIQSNTRIHEKAALFGMPAVRIDGNNAGRVYLEAERAVKRARAGEGPTFIECLTYRWRGHVGPNWDVDMGLRSWDEIEAWMAHCPIRNLKTFMTDRGLIDAGEAERRFERIQQRVRQSLDAARTGPRPEPETLLDNVFWNQK